MKFSTIHTWILKLHKITRTRMVHFTFSCWLEQGNNQKKIALVIQTCVLLLKQNIYVQIYFILHVYRKLVFSLI